MIQKFCSFWIFLELEKLLIWLLRFAEKFEKTLESKFFLSSNEKACRGWIFYGVRESGLDCEFRHETSERREYRPLFHDAFSTVFYLSWFNYQCRLSSATDDSILSESRAPVIRPTMFSFIDTNVRGRNQ